MNRFQNHLFLLLSICSLLFFAGCKNEKATVESESQTTPQIKKDTTAATTVVLPKPNKTIPVADYDTAQWVDLLFMDSTIIIDLRYATENNFVEEKMYECPRCFLRPKVAEVVVKIHKNLQKQDLGLKFFDCYRPLGIQQRLWDKVPDARYVTNPKKGSMHNRGLAVDLTIVDSKGNELDMGTPFDYFGPKGYHTYTKHSNEVNENRHLLKSTMEAAGFKSIRTEWWHYSYRYAKHPLSDMVWKCGK